MSSNNKSKNEPTKEQLTDALRYIHGKMRPSGDTPSFWSMQYVKEGVQKTVTGVLEQDSRVLNEIYNELDNPTMKQPS